jgi:hypothetical protein
MMTRPKNVTPARDPDPDLDPSKTDKDQDQEREQERVFRALMIAPHAFGPQEDSFQSVTVTASSP